MKGKCQMRLEEKIIKNKLGLLELAKQLGNVSRACKIFGYSRDSSYRFKKLYEEGGEEVLKEVSRKKPNIKNRVSSEIEESVCKMAIDYPAYGQVRVSNELRKRGLFVSPGGVRSIWLRHNLETFKKRLKALEEKMAKENLILTESQLQTLEKAKEKKEAKGKIESEHPGYLRSQACFIFYTCRLIAHKHLRYHYLCFFLKLQLFLYSLHILEIF